MSLLKILREHLKEWPEDVRAISQDSDGWMNENRHGDHPLPWGDPYALDSGGWSWPSEYWWYMDNPNGDTYWKLPVADDASTAIVTREMWEGVLPSAHD